MSDPYNKIVGYEKYRKRYQAKVERKVLSDIAYFSMLSFIFVRCLFFFFFFRNHKYNIRYVHKIRDFVSY